MVMGFGHTEVTDRQIRQSLNQSVSVSLPFGKQEERM